MKKLMIGLLLLVAMSSVAAAQMPSIGLYADEVAVLCHAPVPVYAYTYIYVIAVLPPEIPVITACEFRLDNLPTVTHASVSIEWETELVIGTADYGIALAFQPPMAGPTALLGTISIFAIQEFGDDWRMEVMASNDSGNLVVVNDAFELVPCEEGHIFTFNCTGGLPGECGCIEGVATSDATWGSIKALY
jgi:hypothetical protein